MNVVYLHSHDSGRWLQPYSDLVATPAFQGFSEQAAVFTQAFTVCPTCSPSRACLLTGTYPHQHGLMGLAHMGFTLERTDWHLARLLHQHGYRTLLSGIQHEFSSPDHEEVCATLGYDAYIGEREWKTNVMERDHLHAQGAADFLLSPDAKAQPFFLSVGLYNTHRVYHELPAWEGELPPGVPDNEAGRRDFAGYADSLRHLDKAVGTVLEALRQGDHLDDTLIFYTTDHGPAYPGMKCTPTDLGTGVALMLSYPGNQMKGQQIPAMVSHLDVMPTLFELLKLPVPSQCEGHSLVPLLNGEEEEIHDYLITSLNTHVVKEPARAIRTPRFKWVRSYGTQDNESALPNIDNGPVKSWLYPDDPPLPRHAEEHLFDLQNDPEETINLAGDPAYATIQADLDAKLIAWMEEKGDPLLSQTKAEPIAAR